LYGDELGHVVHLHGAVADQRNDRTGRSGESGADRVSTAAPIDASPPDNDADCPDLIR
jgi:hypothetical protein